MPEYRHSEFMRCFCHSAPGDRCSKSATPPPWVGSLPWPPTSKVGDAATLGWVVRSLHQLLSPEHWISV